MHRFRIWIAFAHQDSSGKKQDAGPILLFTSKIPIWTSDFTPHHSLQGLFIPLRHRLMAGKIEPKGHITQGNMDPFSTLFIHTHHKGHPQAVDMDGTKSQTKSDRKAPIGFSSTSTTTMSL
jgi:hypothetical protein